jgi:hypothetical protein
LAESSNPMLTLSLCQTLLPAFLSRLFFIRLAHRYFRRRCSLPDFSPGQLASFALAWSFKTPDALLLFTACWRLFLPRCFLSYCPLALSRNPSRRLFPCRFAISRPTRFFPSRWLLFLCFTSSRTFLRARFFHSAQTLILLFSKKMSSKNFRQ